MRKYVYGTIYMKIIVGFEFTAKSPVIYICSLTYISTIGSRSIIKKIFQWSDIIRKYEKQTSGNKTNAQYKNLVHQYNRNGCSVICKSYCFYCYISLRKCLAKAKVIISKLQQTFCMG